MKDRKYHASILGIPGNADPQAVRKAYRRMALLLHPDKHGGSAEAKEKFQQLSESYHFLLEHPAPEVEENTDPLGIRRPGSREEKTDPAFQVFRRQERTDPRQKTAGTVSPGAWTRIAQHFSRKLFPRYPWPRFWQVYLGSFGCLLFFLVFLPDKPEPGLAEPPPELDAAFEAAVDEGPGLPKTDPDLEKILQSPPDWNRKKEAPGTASKAAGSLPDAAPDSFPVFSLPGTLPVNWVDTGSPDTCEPLVLHAERATPVLTESGECGRLLRNLAARWARLRSEFSLLCRQYLKGHPSVHLSNPEFVARLNRDSDLRARILGNVETAHGRLESLFNEASALHGISIESCQRVLPDPGQLSHQKEIFASEYSYIKSVVSGFQRQLNLDRATFQSGL